MREKMSVEQADAEVYALADRIQAEIQKFNEKTGLFVEQVQLMKADHHQLSGRPIKVLLGVTLEVSL